MFYIFQPGYKLCSRAKRQYNTHYNTIAVKCHSCCSTWPGEFLSLMYKKCQPLWSLPFLLSIGLIDSFVMFSTREFLIEMPSFL